MPLGRCFGVEELFCSASGNHNGLSGMPEGPIRALLKNLEELKAGLSLSSWYAASYWVLGELSSAEYSTFRTFFRLCSGFSLRLGFSRFESSWFGVDWLGCASSCRILASPLTSSREGDIKCEYSGSEPLYDISGCNLFLFAPRGWASVEHIIVLPRCPRRCPNGRPLGSYIIDQ